jgi:hypothetical protein
VELAHADRPRAIASVLAKAIDEMRGDTVGIEPPGHEDDITRSRRSRR